MDGEAKFIGRDVFQVAFPSIISGICEISKVRRSFVSNRNWNIIRDWKIWYSAPPSCRVQPEKAIQRWRWRRRTHWCPRAQPSSTTSHQSCLKPSTVASKLSESKHRNLGDAEPTGSLCCLRLISRTPKWQSFLKAANFFPKKLPSELA